MRGLTKIFERNFFFKFSCLSLISDQILLDCFSCWYFLNHFVSCYLKVVVTIWFIWLRKSNHSQKIAQWCSLYLWKQYDMGDFNMENFVRFPCAMPDPDQYNIHVFQYCLQTPWLWMDLVNNAILFKLILLS